MRPRKEILDFCRKNNIKLFCNILDYSEKYRKDWYYKLLMTNLGEAIYQDLDGVLYNDQ